MFRGNRWEEEGLELISIVSTVQSVYVGSNLFLKKSEKSVRSCFAHSVSSFHSFGLVLV